MSTIPRRSALAVMALAALAFSAGAHAQDLTRVTIGSNPAGTGYHTIGGGLAKVIQETLQVQATVRPFSGSSVYIPMMHRGEITLGLNSSNDSFLSYNAEEPYSDRMSNLRMTMVIWPLPYMYWTRKDTGITSIGDLKGRRIVVTFRGNVSLARVNLSLLATAGLTGDDVEDVVVAGIPQAVDAVVEGRADAAPIALGIALLRQAAARVPGGILILEAGPDEAAQQAIMPSTYISTSQPAEGNVGVEKPTRIGTFDTYLNTGTHVGDEDIYRIVKTLHENWREIQQDIPLLRRQDPDEMAPSDQVVPYHPGAIKYWKEVGTWSDAHEAQQQKVSN